ncbi:J domain-containing protein [Endozoicomonas arenosclerae]|uniref:J domain-containing protein n=1 Tax=Endozoicomonas arenosclerae TaxID=1633495 RepID=UPI00078405D3|nr:J domain-containing protein [Endozoicomonas arenosclerae]
MYKTTAPDATSRAPNDCPQNFSQETSAVQACPATTHIDRQGDSRSASPLAAREASQTVPISTATAYGISHQLSKIASSIWDRDIETEELLKDLAETYQTAYLNNLLQSFVEYRPETIASAISEIKDRLLRKLTDKWKDNSLYSELDGFEPGVDFVAFQLSSLNPQDLHTIVSDIEAEIRIKATQIDPLRVNAAKTGPWKAKSESYVTCYDLQSPEEKNALKVMKIQDETYITYRLIAIQFRKLALEYHPDKTQEDDEEKFKALNSARDLLVRRLEQN